MDPFQEDEMMHVECLAQCLAHRAINSNLKRHCVRLEGNEPMVPSGEGWREGILRESGKDTYTLLYLKWITNKGLLFGIGNPAQCYVAAGMGGQSGGERIHGYVQLSCFSVYPKPSQHC